MTRIIILNPLGGSLAHYRAALEDNLHEVGVETMVLEPQEPSLSGVGRISFLFRYLRLWFLAGHTAKQRPDSCICVIWPMLGYWDLIISRIMQVEVWVIFHDSRPLVQAVGFSPLAKWSARRLSNTKTHLVVHSSQAKAELIDGLKGVIVNEVPHPILRPDCESAKCGNEVEASTGATSVKIRVLGQFKQSRDIDLLARLSESVPQDWELEIVGRGWPPIGGWRVRSDFVTEDEFQALLDTASVVLIPYLRFYQSGVAIRCLERGVPFIGPQQSSLARHFRAGSALLYDVHGTPDAVIKCIEYGLSLAGRKEVNVAGRASWIDCVSGWRTFVQSSGHL